MAKKKQRIDGLPAPTDERDRKLLADVRQFGWQVVAVPEDDEGPGFAYSIGLYHSFKHPEMIVFGLKIDVMQAVVNGIGKQIKAGERFEHLDEAGDILDGYNVCFRHVERKHFPEYLGFALWFYQGNEFPVLQCVWPDLQHRHPWQSDCHPSSRSDNPS